MGPGVKIGRTMAVLKGDDGLVVLNAMRMSESGHAALDALGPVKHLVKLSDSHSIDEPYYSDRYKPTVWTLPGARLGNLAVGKLLGDEHPITGGQIIDFTAAHGWREAACRTPEVPS